MGQSTGGPSRVEKCPQYWHFEEKPWHPLSMDFASHIGVSCQPSTGLTNLAVAGTRFPEPIAQEFRCQRMINVSRLKTVEERFLLDCRRERVAAETEIGSPGFPKPVFSEECHGSQSN